MLPRTSSRPCALFDLTGRGVVAVGGKDRAEFLHGMLTNDIKKLRPGEGCHAALLTPKGKLRAEMNVLCTEERLLLDTPPELGRSLAQVLSGYVFFQEATLEDETEKSSVFHVSGPRAAEVLRAAGAADLPSAPHEHRAARIGSAPARVAAENRTGDAGYDVRVPRERSDAVLEALRAAGAQPAPLDELEAARIEAGIPAWGRELDETVLPNEAFLERTAISYTKGCYVGQEIVARIKTYGHVNRCLVKLLLPPGAEVAPGAEVRAGDAKVGAVTSAAVSSRASRVVALAYVKRENAAPGALLDVATPSGPATAEVEPLTLAA